MRCGRTGTLLTLDHPVYTEYSNTLALRGSRKVFLAGLNRGQPSSSMAISVSPSAV
jgi:hypothetical protein